MKAGRPTIYSDTLANEIANQLAKGKPLTKICDDDDMPSLTTVYRWLTEKETFRDIYTRAREDQADTLADEIIKIADKTDPKDSAAVNKARLQVDARKWVASKLKPKKYGERQAIDVKHGIDDDLKDLSNAELEEELRKHGA